MFIIDEIKINRAGQSYAGQRREREKRGKRRVKFLFLSVYLTLPYPPSYGLHNIFYRKLYFVLFDRRVGKGGR